MGMAIALGDDGPKYSDFYRRVAILDRNGKFKIEGERYDVKWTNSTYREEGAIMAKMAEESKTDVRKFLEKNGRHPLGVVASALEGHDVVCTQIIKPRKSPLEVINDDGLFVHMLRPSIAGVEIADRFYRPVWVKRPTEPSNQKLESMLRSARIMGSLYFRKQRMSPDVILTNSLEGHDSSYSIAY